MTFILEHERTPAKREFESLELWQSKKRKKIHEHQHSSKFIPFRL